MSAIKDNDRKTWRSYIRYTDWQGKNQIHTKRGFKTKREALAYEREFLMKKTRDINMGFSMFVEQYLEDMKPRLKYNTFLTKKHIIASKIIPYFENRTLADIDATDIIQWQNELLKMRDKNDKPYAQTYLRTIQNQLSAIFNHACRFYNLPSIHQSKQGKWGRPRQRKCCFGQKKNTSDCRQLPPKGGRLSTV